MGGQSDNYEYETEAHTFYVGANAKPIPKLDLSGVFSFTKGTANIHDLGFSSDPFTLTVEGRTDDYSFAYINGTEEYSDLEYIMWELELTGNYSITDQLGLTVNWLYSEYQDQEEYVYGELDGKLWMLSSFVTYRF
ncbi:MAG: hypothetical protein AVO38_15285 [delta proteobacterium ML8_D]|nr:MAG: hypothetical protein AVO38_15285 [delta proteobacterium ML8_D]